jgi:zinc protease
VAACAAGLEELAEHGLPPDHYERLPASIASLDAGRIREAARSLSVGREVAVIQGDAATILPQLRAAGFDVEVVKPPEAKAARD